MFFTCDRNHRPLGAIPTFPRNLSADHRCRGATTPMLAFGIGFAAVAAVASLPACLSAAMSPGDVQQGSVLHASAGDPGKPAAPAQKRGGFDDGRASFTVEVQGVESAYRTTPVFVLPGQELSIRVKDAPAPVQAAAEAGQLRIDEPGAWTWTAPEKPGTSSCVRVTEERRLDSICVKAFVLQPYRGEAEIDGFRIGHYPRELLKGDEAYALPQGLVRVTPENVDEPLSPHFRLGQFLCKQEASYPKFLVLKTALIVKLEMLLEKLASDGVIAETLYVMSGYRTPFYNSTIGNETTYSRHSYGDAADVYVDRDADGIMDDIDGDGRTSTDDARHIYRIVDDAMDAVVPQQLAGGLAIYGPNRAHGPFVHVDTRGHRARW